MASRIASEIVYKIVADEKDFIAGMGLAKKESEKLEKALDGTTKTVNTLNKQEIVWGRSLETLKGQQASLKGEINRLITEGIDPNSNVVKKLKAEYDALGTEIKKFPKTFEQVKKSMADAGKKIEDVGKKLSLGLTAPIVAAGTAAVKLASDTGEAFNAANVVFRESTGIIEAWGKNAVEQAGLTSAEFYQASAVIGAGLINAGQSADEAARQTIELTKRAADMASIFNTDVNDALLALQSGLRGESEPLRRFAVNLNEAAVNAKAVELGLAASEKEVSDYAKSQARLSLILEQTNRFQGDFVNTSDQLANSTRILQASIKEQAAELGQALLPAVLQIVSKGRELVDAFSGLDENGRRLVLTLAGVAAALGPILTLAGKLIAGGPIALGIAALATSIGLIAASMARAKSEAQAFSDALSGAADLETTQRVLKAKAQEIDYQKQLIEQNKSFSPIAKKAAEDRLAELQAEYVALVANYNGKRLTIEATEKQRAEETRLAQIKEAAAAKDAADAAAKATADAAELAASQAITTSTEEQIAKEEELAKARADAYGDYIVNIAKIEDARKEASAQELARIEAERAARQAATEQAAQYIYSQLTDVGDQLLQNEIDRINASTLSEKEKAIEIAKVKQKQAIFDKAQALANIAMRTSEAIVSALTVPPPAGEILAGVIGGLAAVQAAAVIAQPLPPIPSFAEGTRNFMVPPGFPNDSFPIMVQSGERVTVETPQQQANGTSDNRPILYVGTLIADDVGLRELDMRMRRVQNIEDARRG